MTKKPNIAKRIMAYALDILIISMLASIITMVFPKNDEYDTNFNELKIITEKYQKEEINQEEYYALYDNINYKLTKNSIEMTIIIIAISLLYFVLLNYYNNGMTIGKKLMKIRIVSANDKELTINKYLLRSLIINSILANLVSVILLLSLSKEKYILYNNKISTLFTVLYVLCFIFMIYRNDGRGLHELIAGTKVIDIKNENHSEVVKEAELIEKEDGINNKVVDKEIKESKKIDNKVNKSNKFTKKKNVKGSDK